MSKKPTIYDVAALSDSSPATVSRVINQPTLVSESTKNKVYAAMQELNYSIKDPLRAQIAGSPDGLIIVHLPLLDNPFYGEVIRGIEAAAHRYNCSVLVLSEEINVASLPNIKSLFKKIKPVGMITTTISDAKTLLLLNDLLPIVQCCECNSEISIPSVTIDDASAAYTAVAYLCSLGKKRIAMINGPLEYKADRERLAGYKRALLSHGLDVAENLITNLPNISYDIAISAVTQMLSQSAGSAPDAFFTSSDVYALAVVRAARTFGLSIPADIAVIGFDNIELAAINVPSITTVNQPRTQLGFSACELLMERILHPEFPVKHMTLETEMIIRESTVS